jgi:hypothetical protein
MAPTKPPTSSGAAKIIPPSLSSPASLLWAHQVRHEHSVLFARIEGFASVIGNVSVVQLNKIAAQATRAENKSSKIESEQSKLKKELDKAHEHEKIFEDEVGRVSGRLEALE